MLFHLASALTDILPLHFWVLLISFTTSCSAPRTHDEQEALRRWWWPNLDEQSLRTEPRGPSAGINAASANRPCRSEPTPCPEIIHRSTANPAPINDLDYGLYWLGDHENKQKYIKQKPNPFYNPQKPVVIFLHGQQWNKTPNNYDREHLFWDLTETWAHHSWLARGWNVGIFYWNQWADERMPWDAEAKIWTKDGPQGLRYRHGDGSYDTAPGLDIPCGELAYFILKEALADNTSANIRLVGHSLGSQMVIRITELFHREIKEGIIPPHFMIKRLALLDPAWIAGERSFLEDLNGDGRNDSTAERCYFSLAEIIAYWHNRNEFSIEIYNTTFLEKNMLMNDNNPALRQIASGTVSVHPAYYSNFDFENQHKSAFFYYFWSMAFPSPRACIVQGTQCIMIDEKVPSAALPDGLINRMMGKHYYWKQKKGANTPTIIDDVFAKTILNS
jgi:hypothetical protein